MDCGIERERERKASRVREAREIRGGWGRWRRVLTMFRVERRPGAEITDQGVSKQLRCRREVRANSMRLEVTARRSRGLRPAAGCGRGSRLTGSALSPPANGRGGYIGDWSISTTPILRYSPGSEGFHCPSGANGDR